MYRPFRMLLLLLLPPLLCACYKTKLQGFSDSGGPGYREKEFVHTLLWGMVPLNSIDVAEICGNKKVWSTSSSIAGLGLIASWFTVGIYTPMTVKVTCSE